MSEIARSAPATRREILAVAALTLLPLLPFLNAAVSFDGPVFIAVARQIVEAPLDPFGFEMLWDSTSLEVAKFNRNPPLLSYYLAAWMTLFGEREFLLHLALLPFPLMSSLAFFGIVRRLTDARVAPVALLVASPAFLVLSTTFLLDVPVLTAGLVAIYALLRGREPGGEAWWVVSGLAAGAAGLLKYVGFSTLPLVAAGVMLLYRRRALPGLIICGLPVALFSAWGAFTAHVYGEVHFFGATDVVADKSFASGHFLNKLLSTPIYYGAGLLFPVLFWARAFRPKGSGTELAVVGVLIGAAAVGWVLPDGQPPRRIPLEADESLIAALGFAGAFALWCAVLDPRRALASAEDRFLALWLAGLFVFSAFLNWHVNAADALLAAPPVLIMAFRHPGLRLSQRAAWLTVAAMLPFSLLLASADVQQSNHYRAAARGIAQEIGDRAGARWFVGHWGLQHYLEREGFEPVKPPMYGKLELHPGDWVVSARNVSQLDVYSTMNPYTIRSVWTWKLESWLPLRATNGDAGAGFYSHHSGYTPFGFSSAPVEVVTLGRITAARR
ncbi:MAG: glycosyltransferase family 39 protein [Myxococcales bacterium]|nr:glycosyltransferase family 39 protein [Myxococcales bacterium]